MRFHCDLKVYKKLTDELFLQRKVKRVRAPIYVVLEHQTSGPKEEGRWNCVAPQKR